MRRRFKKGKAKTKDDLIRHALRRFEQRYGESITNQQIHKWNKDIEHFNDNVKLLEKQSNTRIAYLINEKIYAVYNKQKLFSYKSLLFPKNN